MQTLTNQEMLNIVCNATTSLNTIIANIKNYTCLPLNIENADNFDLEVDLSECQIPQDKFLPVIDNLMNYFSRCKDYIHSHIAQTGSYLAHFSFAENDKLGWPGTEYLMHSLYNTLKDKVYGVVTFYNNSMFANSTITELVSNSLFANCSAIASNSTTMNNTYSSVFFINGEVAQNNSCHINDIETAKYYLPFHEEATGEYNKKILEGLGILLFLAFVGVGTAATCFSLSKQASSVDNDPLNEEMLQQDLTLLGEP